MKVIVFGATGKAGPHAVSALEMSRFLLASRPRGELYRRSIEAAEVGRIA